MPHSAATPRLLRRVNAQAVLAFIRSTDVATGTELMARTGLTRASVIAVCEDLIRRGWIRELDTPRGDPAPAPGSARKGRPARRFELNHAAGYVLGIDIGAATTTAAVADLRGTVVGRSSGTSGPRTSPRRSGSPSWTWPAGRRWELPARIPPGSSRPGPASRHRWTVTGTSWQPSTSGACSTSGSDRRSRGCTAGRSCWRTTPTSPRSANAGAGPAPGWTTSWCSSPANAWAPV